MFDLNMKDNIAYYVSMDNKIYARQLLLPIDNDEKELIKEAGGEISGKYNFMEYFTCIFVMF